MQSGEGKAKAVISADIFDEDGNIIGDIRQIALEAITIWERLLAEYGVNPDL